MQGIFVSIAIPADAAPGVYRGAVSVTAEGLDTPLEKQLTLEVLDMVQPAPEAYRFDIELWQYPYRVAQYYGLEPFSQAHLDALRPHLQRYRALGGHAITASIVEEPWNGQTYGSYPSMVKWTRRADKSFAFDFTDFDKWVTLCQELGLGDKIVCYSLIPWGNKVTYYDEKSKQSDLPHLAPAHGAIKSCGRPFYRPSARMPKRKGGMTGSISALMSVSVWERPMT